MKNIGIGNLPTISIKRKPEKKKVLAEVLVGAAVAAGITYTVKKLIDRHHADEAKKAGKKTEKTKQKAKR